MRKHTPIRVAAAVPATNEGKARIGNEQGAVAVIVALVLTLLLGVMALTMDTGYLYLKKNQYQNGVEAAALAGVRQICEGDWEVVARQVAGANGLPDDAQSLTVETGYYDERDQYSQNLGEYKDYGPPPSGQYVNAVRVRLEQSLPSLTGMNAAATVVAEAVAYLKRIDIASLDPDGSIRLGHNSVWEDTVFWANGDILYPQTTTMGEETYYSPEFNESELLAAGEVRTCPVNLRPYKMDYSTGKMLYNMDISWNSGSNQSGGYISTGLDALNEIRPVDEATLDYWRQRADIIYTPNQEGQDDIFYTSSNESGKLYYIVDAATDTNTPRIIFFDAGENEQGTVLLGPRGIAAPSTNHSPNGSTMTGLTFVASCPIRVQNYIPQGDSFTLHIGGEDENQTLIVSSGDIEIFTSHISYDGVVFRAGKDFIQLGSGAGGEEGVSEHIRIIADGDVHGADSSYLASERDLLHYTDDQGLLGISNNSLFGPPCPPGMARLGLLKQRD